MSNNQQSRDDVRVGAGLRGRLGDTGWTRTRAVLSLGMVLGLGAVGTMAAWSDSATATTGMFSTSAIQMRIDGQRPAASFTALNKNSMLPGNSTAGQIKVQNTGTIDYKWAVSASGSGSPELLSKLSVSVHAGGANDDSTCTGTTLGSASSLSDTAALVSGRALAAGEDDVVCIQVDVASTAGKAEQFKIADLGFSFTAEGQ